jgi:hypothetical protein
MTRSPQSAEISVGDELPRFDLPVTSTVIVAGAIASRDFMPAHHDPEFARAQGAPDMFMKGTAGTVLADALPRDRGCRGSPEAACQPAMGEHKLCAPTWPNWSARTLSVV